jgi:hypothetical protein
MEQPSQKLTMYEPVVYEVCVQGELTESWCDYFSAQSITVERSGGGNVVTTLVSEPMDQGTLVGLINALNTFGIPVISLGVVSQVN